MGGRFGGSVGAPGAPGSEGTSEDLVRRRLRALFVGLAGFLFISGSGTIVTYLNARPLLAGPTQAVTGEIVREEPGLLGVRNLVTVTYEVDGAAYEATIPVKGAGFTGSRLQPYFYEPGDPVALEVELGHPSAVRTRERWVPAVYNWAAVLALAVLLPAMFAIVGAARQRSIRRRERSPANTAR